MIIAIFIFFVISVSCIPEETCNRIQIGDNWYEKEVLWSNFGRPYNLYVHKASNTLFFIYSITETYTDIDFLLATFSIDTREYQAIAGIKGGCSVAIDQLNDEIYLGGSDGIHKYNILTKLADFYKEKGKNIWSLFYRTNLFYISYPDQKLHIEIDERFAIVKEFENIEIDQFHVATNNDIYYGNKTGLFKYDNRNGETKLIDELLTVRQIVDDNEGDLYVCTNFGVFSKVKNLKEEDKGLQKILDFKNIYGLTFDRDNNLIYSDEKRIIRLLYSTMSCVNKETSW